MNGMQLKGNIIRRLTFGSKITRFPRSHRLRHKELHEFPRVLEKILQDFVFIGG